ncbi:MAG: BrnT family toxin [Candidatus Pacebacteria bacterium]|nr:BrnT family toxin [Candidatus Paceibacterota bacterium]
MDENRVEIHAPHPVETRHILIGKMKKRLWAVIYTTRAESIRIISVRRAREKEVTIYGKEKTGKER